MAAKSPWDQIKKMAKRVFKLYIYYLYDFKPVAKIIPKNMTRLNYLTFTDGLEREYVLFILSDTLVTVVFLVRN